MSERITFEAIGTHWTIDIYSNISSDRLNKISDSIRSRIDLFDAAYSRFRQDSIITTLSRQSGPFVFPEDSKPMFSLYEQMYRVTSGAMTPLIGQVISDAGYDAEYSLKPKPLSRPPEWSEVFYDDFVQNLPAISLKKPALIDVGAIGKGYLIDIVSDMLEKNGIYGYCVDAGGDMRHRDQSGTTLRVGLENPNDTSQVVGVLFLGNRSVCGSAGNRRAWSDFHHIINPRTLSSPRHIAAVWTVADSTMLADALSTALFFVEPDTLYKEFSFEYLIIDNDYAIKKSPDFPVELFS